MHTALTLLASVPTDMSEIVPSMLFMSGYMAAEDLPLL
jgi:hypothetical protein